MATLYEHCGLSTDKPFCQRCGFDLQHGKEIKRKECIYCTEKSVSDEHVFGKWLCKRYREEASISNHILQRPETLTPASPLHRHHRIVGKKAPYSAITRNVCQKCNNTWLSKIHTAAQSKIIALVDANLLPARSRECKQIARWVAMVAINLQHYGRIISVSPEHLGQFYNEGFPGGCWQISYLRTVNKFPGRSRSVTLNVMNEDGSTDANVGLIYFFVQNVLFFVMYASNAATFLALESRIAKSRIPNYFKSIWPNPDSSKHDAGVLSNYADFFIESISAEMLKSSKISDLS